MGSNPIGGTSISFKKGKNLLKITIYTTTTCPFCKMQKDYLASKNIRFEEVLVDNNPLKAQEMIEMSGQMGVPFTIIEREDGQKITILGFDRPKIDEALGLSIT